MGLYEYITVPIWHYIVALNIDFNKITSYDMYECSSYRVVTIDIKRIGKCNSDIYNIKEDSICDIIWTKSTLSASTSNLDQNKEGYYHLKVEIEK